MDRIKRGAQEFLDQTLPAECPDGQQVDQRTAFYSGFYYCLTFATRTISSLSDDDAEAALVLAEAEVKEYFASLPHGFDRAEVPAGSDSN